VCNQDTCVYLLSAASTVIRNKYNEHTSTFKNLKILPYDKILLEAIYEVMHCYFYKKCSRLFNNTWTATVERDGNSAPRNDDIFVIAHPRNELFKRSPYVYMYIPNLRNDPNEIHFMRMLQLLKLQ
jgi:hypothetical protein